MLICSHLQKDHLQMYKCKNLKPGKDANSITFHLPHRHKKDSCDILIYENFNCEGEPYISKFSPLAPSTTLDMLTNIAVTGHPENADKCVSTPNAKSIFIGPCKDKELLWTDDRQSIVVGYEPLCGFPSSIC
jgi:hypothetical protein